MLGLIFIIAMLTITVACVMVVLCTSAIVFSRVAFALLVALALINNGTALVPNSGFLNFVAWAMVSYGAVYLLSRLPRVDIALNFLCTTFMSVMVIFIVVMLFGSIFAGISGSEFKLTLLYEIVIKVICLAIGCGAVVLQTKKAAYDAPKNKLMRLLEKVAASLMYGGAITFLAASLNGNWKFSDAVMWAIFIVTTVAAYIADAYIKEKFLFAPVEEQNAI